MCPSEDTLEDTEELIPLGVDGAGSVGVDDLQPGDERYVPPHTWPVPRKCCMRCSPRSASRRRPYDALGLISLFAPRNIRSLPHPRSSTKPLPSARSLTLAYPPNLSLSPAPSPNLCPCNTFCVRRLNPQKHHRDKPVLER
eukprot:365856-Chlamydomonas_euryale.AAC.3